MTVRHHGPKTTKEPGPLALKKACPAAGIDEELGRVDTDHHPEYADTLELDPGPLLDVHPLTTNGEKGNTMEHSYPGNSNGGLPTSKLPKGGSCENTALELVIVAPLVMTRPVEP